MRGLGGGSVTGTLGQAPHGRLEPRMWEGQHSQRGPQVRPKPCPLVKAPRSFPASSPSRSWEQSSVPVGCGFLSGEERAA